MFQELTERKTNPLRKSSCNFSEHPKLDEEQTSHTEHCGKGSWTNPGDKLMLNQDTASVFSMLIRRCLTPSHCFHSPWCPFPASECLRQNIMNTAAPAWVQNSIKFPMYLSQWQKDDAKKKILKWKRNVLLNFRPRGRWNSSRNHRHTHLCDLGRCSINHCFLEQKESWRKRASWCFCTGAKPKQWRHLWKQTKICVLKECPSLGHVACLDRTEVEAKCCIGTLVTPMKAFGRTRAWVVKTWL